MNAKLKLIASQSFDEYLKAQEELKQYNLENPRDAPNEVLEYALIEGVKLTNDELFKPSDLNHLFSVKNEEIFVWTYEKDTLSRLISKVNLNVKELLIWKTAASILEAALCLHTDLENLPELTYNWIYRFNPFISKDKQHFRDSQDLLDGTISFSYNIFRIFDFANVLTSIELLDRDDLFYVAAQNLIAAKSHHNFCQVCIFEPEHLRKHKDTEPESWEKIKILPKMEAAVVFAARSVEALIGKPGKNRQRIKEKWIKTIDLPPDDLFELSGSSYLDYYYELFLYRNVAAHSFGKLNFDLYRAATIQAQSFAFLILREYYAKNKLPYEQAGAKLNFNWELVKAANENYSSNRTKI